MAETFSSLLLNHISSIYRAAIEDSERVLSNISIAHTALMLCLQQSPFIFLEDTPEAALRLHQDFAFFKGLIGSESNALLLPPPVNIELIGRRIEALREYLQDDSLSLITSPAALDNSMDIFSLQKDALSLMPDMEIERTALKQWLLKSGYQEVSMVIDKGEFSHRSFIFDIFPSTANRPARIEFFGDSIDSIRAFDIETQRSARDIARLDLFSTLERNADEDMLQQMLIIKKPGIFIAGMIKIEDLHLSGDDIALRVYHNPINKGGIASLESSFAGMGILPQERKGYDDFAAFIRGASKPFIVVLQSKAQADRLRDMLEGEEILVPIIEPQEVSSYYGRGCITIGTLSSGINLPDIFVLTDREIFGERPPVKASRPQKLSRILLNLEELKPGDWIVHREHGIGRFKGILRQETGGYEQDLISIEYGNGSLYIPAENIRLIQKYSASEDSVPVVDKIGSKNWHKNKLKARLGAEEVAKKLIKLYAERTVSRGFVFSEDTAMHREFDDFFAYQETPDQARAIEDIKRAMYSEKPMDMLLCGDVGYGKTEVVMRAIFRAVYDKKQAAVLVPTTILAEQHYRTFKSRFSGFPVKIDTLNRFRSASERAKTLKALKSHEVDVVIGTHSLLRKDIAFADLGLLVIDEEHKFGVQQKERLKELRKAVDVITLTATPIPRTLQMSLSGIREMSIIETPPEDRVSVKTFTSVFNGDIIKEAIERELRRQGQVYYVHNRIGRLEEKARLIRGLVGHARVAIAHGEIPERDLERVMFDFMNHRIDVLLCTAIIGSGLDIPSANTIIIDRADIFGLADLYQLRGRVGRSNVQAYAYLLIPEEERIGEDAMKRLQAVQDLSYLGAGFRIALKDLEIRGAGNILGAEQSGHIYRVGFDMYMEMLEESVAELKGETLKATLNPEIKVALSAYISESYINDITMRISVYRRLSECTTLEELSDRESELADRFGAIPMETSNLIDILRVKILSRRLLINRIVETHEDFRFYFQRTEPELYGAPKDFFVDLFDALNHLQKTIKRFRFIEGGFSIARIGKAQQKPMKRLEETLMSIYTEYQRRKR